MPEEEPTGSGGTPSDEAAWAEIVANFGERAVLDDESTSDGPGTATEDPTDGPPAAVEGVVLPAAEAHPDRDEVGEREERWERSERFVPPEPEPLPRTTPLRTAAWFGTLGVPLVVLVLALVPFDLPRLVFGMLLGWFVAGFMYLVVTMSRSPRDPWDDGSRV